MSRMSDLLERTRRTAPAGVLDGNGAAPRLRPRDGVEAPTAPSRARRLLSPMPLTGMALVLVALVGYLVVYSSTTERTPIVVAAHALPAGSVLRASDVRVAELAGDRAVISDLIHERDLDAVLGERLSTAVTAGAPLARGAVVAQLAQTAFTLEVPTARAVGGALRSGDRITVLATFGANGDDAQTRAVARDLTVIAVGQSPAPGEDTTSVTVALSDSSLAGELALANDAARLNLLREGGEEDRAAAIPTARIPTR